HARAWLPARRVARIGANIAMGMMRAVEDQIKDARSQPLLQVLVDLDDILLRECAERDPALVRYSDDGVATRAILLQSLQRARTKGLIFRPDRMRASAQRLAHRVVKVNEEGRAHALDRLTHRLSSRAHQSTVMTSSCSSVTSTSGRVSSM